MTEKSQALENKKIIFICIKMSKEILTFANIKIENIDFTAIMLLFFWEKFFSLLIISLLTINKYYTTNFKKTYSVF